MQIFWGTVVEAVASYPNTNDEVFCAIRRQKEPPRGSTRSRYDERIEVL
jgi:hypothetical protein